MSWLTNWIYRKSHSISAATGAGTNYQIKIKADYASSSGYKYRALDNTPQWLQGAGEQNMRTSFYGVGLHWSFYCDGTNIVFKTSSDGYSWSEKTVIAASGRLYHFGIFWDDPHLHYGIFHGANDIRYRRGTPNANGTITWDSAEVVAVTFDATNPLFAKDSDGKIWMTFCKQSSPNFGFWVTKNDATDGSWSTASGYPKRLAAGIDEYGRSQGSICALTNGKMYIAYGHQNAAETTPSLAFGKLYDGENWGSQETISTELLSVLAGNSVTVDAKGDDVYCVYPVEDVTDTSKVTFNKRTYGVGWGSEEFLSGDLGGATGSIGPAMTFNPVTEELWVFYADPSVDKIYVRKQTAGVWADQKLFYDFSGIHNMDLFWVNAFRRPWNDSLSIKFDSNAGATNKVWWIGRLSASDSNELVFLNEKCRTDFGDVRFTDNDGETLLDYWMQEKVDSDYAIFWVKIADDLSTETQSIYLYYDNEEATYPVGDDQDEMDATFLFADHFYGDTLDTIKWDLVNSPTIVVSDSICTVTDSTSGWRGISSDNSFGAYGIAWMSRKQFPAWFSMAGMENVTIYGDDAMVFWNDSAVGLGRAKTYNEGVGDSTQFSLDTGYHIFEITWKAGECKFYVDDTLKVTRTTTIPDEALKAWIEQQNTSQSSDWVAIRKFVDPEPTHGVWGSQEFFPSESEVERIISEEWNWN